MEILAGFDKTAQELHTPSCKSLKVLMSCYPYYYCNSITQAARTCTMQLLCEFSGQGLRATQRDAQGALTTHSGFPWTQIILSQSDRQTWPYNLWFF